MSKIIDTRDLNERLEELQAIKEAREDAEQILADARKKLSDYKAEFVTCDKETLKDFKKTNSYLIPRLKQIRPAINILSHPGELFILDEIIGILED